MGLELKLSPDTLKAISRKYSQSVNDCFVEMLSKWLRSGCRPTWEDMISALRSPVVGLQALAIKLEKETGKVPSPPLPSIPCTLSSLCHNNINIIQTHATGTI